MSRICLTKVKGLILVMLVCLMFSPPVNGTHPRDVGIQIDQASTITGLQLDLDSYEVEYGNTIQITYGVKNNDSGYEANISQTILLASGKVNTSISVFSKLNSTVVINETSSANASVYYLETLPPSGEPIKPGGYTLFYFTNRVNATNYNTTIYFDVFPHEGSNIVLTFARLPPKSRVTSPIILPLNSSQTFLLTLTNAGNGNALDVHLAVEGINGPHQYDSASTPFHTNVMTTLSQVSFNFSVISPAYGIGEFRFSLTYNNTLGRTTQETISLEFYTLPTITATINQKTDAITGETTEFEVVVDNRFEVEFITKFSLVSHTFSFQPLETQFNPLHFGYTSIVFNGISFINGTYDVSLMMTYLDPIGNDQLNIEITSIKVRVFAAPQPADTDLSFYLNAIIFLYGLLFLIIILLYFSKSLRKFVLRALINRTFVPDIDFENKKVIVDGSNVAWEELDEQRRPQIVNIESAISTLKKYGFEEIIVVADAALRHQLSSKENFDDASKKGIIKVLPAKVDGDSFILRLAREMGALVLTNDLYKEYRSEFPWIDERRIPFSILEGKFYLHPIYDI